MGLADGDVSASECLALFENWVKLMFPPWSFYLISKSIWFTAFGFTPASEDGLALSSPLLSEKFISIEYKKNYEIYYKL